MTELWLNYRYEVVEDKEDAYTASYTGNNALLTENSNTNVAITNTYGRDIGRLKIMKANFNSTPAKPDEAFTFIIKYGDDLADLTDEGISIRKTGGSGDFTALDLERGRFTLKYNTEIVIYGLPKGAYTVTEEVSGYSTYYVVTDSSGPARTVYQSTAAIEVFGGKETAVTFTNNETPTRTTNTEKPKTPETPAGNESVRLKIAKVNFIKTPAKPYEAFTFEVKADGNSVDLSSDDVKIRKTGGAGVYHGTNLKAGRFTLTYDTEITIENLKPGVYTVTEDVTGYITTYEVTNNTEVSADDGSVVTEIAFVFTNEEIAGDTVVKPTDAGIDAGTQQTGIGTSEDDVSTVGLGSISLGMKESDGDAGMVKNPKTGESRMIGTALSILAASIICVATLMYFRFSPPRNAWRKRTGR